MYLSVGFLQRAAAMTAVSLGATAALMLWGL